MSSDLLHRSRTASGCHPPQGDRLCVRMHAASSTSILSCLRFPRWGSSLWLLQPILGVRQMELMVRPSPKLRRGARADPSQHAGAWPTTLPEFPSRSSLAPRNQLGESTDEGYLSVE